MAFNEYDKPSKAMLSAIEYFLENPDSLFRFVLLNEYYEPVGDADVSSFVPEHPLRSDLGILQASDADLDRLSRLETGLSKAVQDVADVSPDAAYLLVQVRLDEGIGPDVGNALLAAVDSGASEAGIWFLDTVGASLHPDDDSEPFARVMGQPLPDMFLSELRDEHKLL